MSQLASILTPEGPAPTTASILTASSSSAILIGRGKKFSVTAVDSNASAVPFQIAYGTGSFSASASNDLFPPGKFTMQSGNGWDSIAIYNPTSATITIYVSLLTNA